MKVYVLVEVFHEDDHLCMTVEHQEKLRAKFYFTKESADTAVGMLNSKEQDMPPGEIIYHYYKVKECELSLKLFCSPELKTSGTFSGTQEFMCRKK